MEWRERQVTSGSGLQGSAGVVLSISHVKEDHAVLKCILHPQGWLVQAADCCEEAFRRLSSCPVSAIIANDALPDGDWMRILRHAQAQSRPPKLIVASRLADERLWAEVLNLGGYDVLIKPFVADEVRRVVSLACPFRLGATACLSLQRRTSLPPPHSPSVVEDSRRFGGAHAN